MFTQVHLLSIEIETEEREKRAAFIQYNTICVMAKLFLNIYFNIQIYSEKAKIFLKLYFDSSFLFMHHAENIDKNFFQNHGWF